MVWEVIILNFTSEQSILALRVEKFRQPIRILLIIVGGQIYRAIKLDILNIFKSFSYTENIFRVLLLYLAELQPQDF